MKNYTYGYSLKERGGELLNLEDYTDCQKEKKSFVNNFLSEAINRTKFWKKVEYVVWKFPEGFLNEYLVLYSFDDIDSRYINVTGNSLAAVFLSLAENIW